MRTLLIVPASAGDCLRADVVLATVYTMVVAASGSW
jgi:hypothetical protein